MLQSTAADVSTVLVAGQIRKLYGGLTGVDLDAVRRRADAAPDRLRQAASAPPSLPPEAVHGWFTQAERMASANFARAHLR
ncbi:hypothetical protein [Streptosporangium saharense]|uniref:hypothetical protein n=1 Tax=Streptosporangium saharense TaxID=1706840 RepID=UPI00343D26F7